MARPFIKWVGGKSQLLGDLLPLFPRRIKTYIEPFIGGGSIFFTLAAEGRFGKAVINDWNTELTDAYRIIRDFPDLLMANLRVVEERYAQDPKAIFDAYRDKDPKDMDVIDRAVRFIFLNKTGFNGLYRVNKAGKFNVPWGHKPKVNTFEADNIRDCHILLSERTTILTGDFEAAVDGAVEGDFVYLDPPYAPVSKTSDFASYTELGFGPEDQKRVFSVFKSLYDRGIFAIVSNSDAPELRDLYAGFEIQLVDARRNVNSKGDGRGPVKEIVVLARKAP